MSMRAKKTLLPAVVLLLVAGLPAAASAAIVQIQVGGVDLVYDGSYVTDASLSQPDPLSNATFIVDSTIVGAITSGVTMDLSIPDVYNIPVSGGQVISAANGTLNLDLGGTEFLNLTLDAAMISYIPLTSTVQFVFAGSTAGIDGQQLPYGLALGEPVSVSFSTQVSQQSS